MLLVSLTTSPKPPVHSHQRAALIQVLLLLGVIRERNESEEDNKELLLLLGVIRERNESEEDDKELLVHVQGNGILLLLFLRTMRLNVSHQEPVTSH
jgi:hypothetical protein